MSNKKFYLFCTVLCVVVFLWLNMKGNLTYDREVFFILSGLNILVSGIILVLTSLYLLMAHSNLFKVRIVYPALISLLFGSVLLAYLMISKLIYGKPLYQSILWPLPFIAMCVLHHFMTVAHPMIKDSNILIALSCYVISFIVLSIFV